ncbi:MAG: hypothetical protein AB8B86_14270 [Pseudomonadales bacterium]
MTFYRVTSVLIFFGLFSTVMYYYFDICVAREKDQKLDVSTVTQYINPGKNDTLRGPISTSPAATSASVIDANGADVIGSHSSSSARTESGLRFSRSTVAALHSSHRSEEDPFDHNTEYTEGDTIEIGEHLDIDDADCCDESKAEVREIGEYLIP